ncbi:hypothetical protein VTI74DRAFT_269 [Chaetomium olivicolor]
MLIDGIGFAGSIPVPKEDPRRPGAREIVERWLTGIWRVGRDAERPTEATLLVLRPVGDHSIGRKLRPVGNQRRGGSVRRRVGPHPLSGQLNRLHVQLGLLLRGLILAVVLGADLNVLLDDVVVVANEMSVESDLVEGDPATARTRRDRVPLIHGLAVASRREDASSKAVSNVDEADDTVLVRIVLRRRVPPEAEQHPFDVTNAMCLGRTGWTGAWTRVLSRCWTHVLLTKGVGIDT